MEVSNVSEMIITYLNNSQLWIVFLIALFVIWKQTDKQTRAKLSIVIVLSMVLVFNNMSRNVIGRLTSVDVYYRFLWCVPIALVVALVLVKLFLHERKWLYRIIGIVVLYLCLQFVGGTYFHINAFVPQENQYHISSETVAICDIIEQDKAEENPIVAFDTMTQLEARQYNPSLRWGISRNAYLYINNTGYDKGTGQYIQEERLIKLMNNGWGSTVEDMQEALNSLQIDYIVLVAFEGDVAYMEQLGCEYVGGTSFHNIFRYTQET